MNKQTTFFLVVCLLLGSSSCTGQKNSKTLPTADTCLSNLKFYSTYWKKDSIGDNGFRDLFSLFKLEKCSFKNTRWEEISKYLGSPNFTFKHEDYIHYRYKLTNFGSDLSLPGTRILEIFVDSKSDLITSFFIKEIDG